MSIPIEKLLQPVSAEQPCGPDLSYDPRFDELETLLKGKPGVEIGSMVKPAEPPEWATLKSKAVEFFGAAKHLRPAVILACAALRVDGLEGIRDGLKLIRGLLEQYWGHLHPLLDPEDNNDPQQRLSILSGLASPRNPGSDVAGWLQVVDYLYQAPLCAPRGVPPITLDMLDTAQGSSSGGGAGGGGGGMDLASLETQIRSASPGDLTAKQAVIKEAIDTRGRLDRANASYLPGAEAAGEAGAGSEAGETGGGVSGPAISGSIRSRDDVVRMLEKICDYYRQVEPGSPVPYLLRRAQKLAGMNFVDAMQELSLATLDQLRPAMGTTLPEPAG
jgi:type VI secretion system protein ImpA